MPVLPSPGEIEAAKTSNGAWTITQLAEWGVPRTPPKGWKDELIERWEAARQEGAPPPPRPARPRPTSHRRRLTSANPTSPTAGRRGVDEAGRAPGPAYGCASGRKLGARSPSSSLT